MGKDMGASNKSVSSYSVVSKELNPEDIATENKSIADTVKNLKKLIDSLEKSATNENEDLIKQLRANKNKINFYLYALEIPPEIENLIAIFGKNDPLSDSNEEENKILSIADTSFEDKDNHKQLSHLLKILPDLLQDVIDDLSSQPSKKLSIQRGRNNTVIVKPSLEQELIMKFAELNNKISMLNLLPHVDQYTNQLGELINDWNTLKENKKLYSYLQNHCKDVEENIERLVKIRTQMSNSAYEAARPRSYPEKIFASVTNTAFFTSMKNTVRNAVEEALQNIPGPRYILSSAPENKR